MKKRPNFGVICERVSMAPKPTENAKQISCDDCGTLIWFDASLYNGKNALKQCDKCFAKEAIGVDIP